MYLTRGAHIIIGVIILTEYIKLGSQESQISVKAFWLPVHALKKPLQSSLVIIGGKFRAGKSTFKKSLSVSRDGDDCE